MCRRVYGSRGCTTGARDETGDQAVRGKRRPRAQYVERVSADRRAELEDRRKALAAELANVARRVDVVEQQTYAAMGAAFTPLDW
jgi:hypothetical protein